MAKDWQKILVAPSVSKNAERLAHYFAMLHDLDLANMSLVRMAQHQTMREHEDSDTVSENIYFDYALMHYFRCFSKSRQSLGVRVFESLEYDTKRLEAKRLHAFFEETYQAKSVRPDDIFSHVKIAVALEDGEKKGVQDVFWLMNRFEVCKPDLTKAFNGLVIVVKDQVSILAKEATDDLLNEAKELGNDVLYKMALNAKDFSQLKSAAVENINLAKDKGQ
ncbi:MAG: hypothetical protein ACI9TY_000570 [Alphaproteobacteria bacterium]|jgi:hypothetical protein